MAYSKIEQAYIDSLVQAQFPDPVEPEPTLLASADTGVATDAPSGIRVGRAGVPFKGPSMSDITEPAMGLLDMGAATVKGATQGFIGLPGDLEGLGRLALNYMGVNVDEATKLPTTEEVKKFFDEKLGPVGNGKNPYESIGELVAPGGQLKAVKPVAKVLKGAVKMTEGLPVGLSTKAVGQGVDDLGFYSAASQAVDAIQQPKGTGEQFLAQISKTPGVKPDEIKWTGLDDFLKSKKSVTKQEVQDYLAKNRVEIKEVQLGDLKLNDKSEYALPEVLKVLKENQSNGYSGMRLTLANDYDAYQALTKKFPNLEDTDNWEDRVLSELIGPDAGGTQFSKWQLPGGQNYREVFMTLPTKTVSEDEARVILGASPDAKLSEADIYYASRKNQDEYIVPRAHSAGKNEADINRIAHLRVNDRVDVDGKKVLFVEEVQSDWHQAGRKNGYQGQKSEYEQFKNELVKKYNVEDLLDLEKVATPEENAKFNKLLQEQVKQINQVPDAPFKTTWSELAMKRAIQMASEGGYERIAFTTGKTQADRYALSKQINDLTAEKLRSGTMQGKYSITATDKDGKLAINEVVAEDKLEDLFGKDLAKKIIDDSLDYPDGKKYQGLDLDVGGEGMKGFYDNILPKFLDKYAKKWDAKTGMSEIKAGDKNEPVHYIDITPKMRESVVTKGQPMFAIGAGGAGAATQQNQENK